MSRDKEPLARLDELVRMLEQHEGPEEARRKLASSPSRPGLRWTGAVAAGALVAGGGLGFGLGSSVTPSGNAAASPAGLGFVPDSGWTVLQSGRDATGLSPALAIASTVPLHPDDDARGLRRSSGLPYATLLELPADGVVIVATFSLPPGEDYLGERFPEKRLPLRLRDATEFVRNATQIRPDRPLGEYELRANVNGRDVQLHFYFGRREPTRALVTAAQRQLDRLIVEPARRAASVEQRALPLRRAQPSATTAPAAKVIDRTLACSTGMALGARTINVSARSAFRKGERLEWMAQAVVATPGQPLPRRDNYLPTLAGVVAGWPPPPPITSGSLGFSTKRCKPTKARVRLTTRGLRGGEASVFGDELKCRAAKTVLIRVRAAFVESTTLAPNEDRDYLNATARVQKGQIAARGTNGKPLVYGEVLDSGKARIYSAPSCF